MWGIWLLATLHSTGLGEKAADKNGPLDCQAAQEDFVQDRGLNPMPDVCGGAAE
jgi:hypothetical protein